MLNWKIYIIGVINIILFNKLFMNKEVYKLFYKGVINMWILVIKFILESVFWKFYYKKY